MTTDIQSYADLYTAAELDSAKKARTFAQDVLEPLRSEIDKGGLCRDLMKDLGKAGLLGTTIGTEFGGFGLGLVHNALISEEIGSVAPSLGAMRGVSDVFVGVPLTRYATQEQKESWLRPMVTGSASYSLGITEPSAGSDAAGISTVAKKDGQSYVANGVKHYISGAAENDAALMYLVTNPDASPSAKLSAFFVPLDLQGLTITPIPTTGLRGFSHARIELDNVHIPVENLIGEEGQGMEIMMNGLGPERIDIAARALACARRALDESVTHALTRTQFGQPISRNQGVSHQIANMRTWLDAARLLLVRAARLEDAGKGSEQATAIAKLYATERGFAICDRAMQILAARGYSTGSPVDLVFRDIRALRFGGGTDEIMRHVIQREEFVSERSR